MAIKFEINMTNKWLYSLIAIGVVLALGVGVYAYQSNMNAGNPPVMGHSAGEVNVEVDGTVMSLQDALDNINQRTWTPLNTKVLDSISNSWTTLDLSSYVGTRSALVLFRYEAVDTGIAHNYHSIAIRNSNTDKELGYYSVATGPGAGASMAQPAPNQITYLVMATDEFGKVEVKGYVSSHNDLYIEGYI